MMHPAVLAAALVGTLTLALGPAPARADDLEGGGGGDPGAETARDPAPLWHFVDPRMQAGLERELGRLGLGRAVDAKRLAVALVDVTDDDAPRVAAVNGDEMLYAASLPKIAVLLAAFERVAAGELALDAATTRDLEDMIRKSSNGAASALMERVGTPYIARVLRSPRYRLYDAVHNGGLWCGKRYAQAGLWRRDPLHNLSHGATAMQVARFYYLLATDRLVSPASSREMKRILGDSAIHHKFVAGLHRIAPEAVIYRKSGSWRQWHADSALVERDGRRYIAVALCESPEGGAWLEDVIVALDHLVFATAPRAASVARVADPGR